MSTFNKVLLSGSTGGRPIQVGATSGTGTTIHTTQVSSSTIDEVWLYATNVTGTSVDLTIDFGGTATGDKIITTLPAKQALYILAPGLVLTGDGSNGRVIRATASTTNVINVTGYINRITP